MRSITKKIVTTMFLLVLYFIYSAFLKEFQEKNSVLFSLFDPFKLIILAFIFSIIVSTFNSIFLGWIKKINAYQKNRNSFLLIYFDETIAGLKKTQILLKSKNTQELKSQLSLVNKLTYKPIFMKVLIEDLINAIICEKDLSDFDALIENCIEQIEGIKVSEQNHLITNKREAFFDVRKSYEYNSQGSKFYIDYYQKKQDILSKNRRNEWNLLSLQMLRIYPIIIYSVLISLLACILITPLAVFVIKGNTFIIIAATFVSFSTCLAVIWHSIYLFKDPNSRVLIKRAMLFYLVLIIMAINLIWCFVNIQNTLTVQTTENGQQELFNFLFEILYCVLSTALMAYVFTTLIELFRDVYFNKIILWEGIIVPSIVFFVISIINILNLSLKNSQFYFSINLWIMSLYWIGVWMMTPILKF
ncbi:hypothetical protein [Spiroplasma endosymbiont of Panorpa germanica]|uniref:hypothetical protein n=1 Tax=Spiroplasma endosymbiont of Panorpa germanica TaxID=3066314 RepID=UPI0030D11A26